MLFQTKDNVSLMFQIIAVALAIATLVLGCAFGAWSWYFGRMSDGKYTPNQGVDIGSAGSIVEGDGSSLGSLATLPPIAGDAGAAISGEDIHPQELNNLQANIKNWMNNGSPVRSQSVTNILLIGMDNENLKSNSRADAMVIFSINHSTKTITLASIMRDQYSYIVHDNKGAFEKLHHANAYGGPTLQIQMLERYYKVSIDNYAIVNFASLPKVIDAMGGVEMELTQEESQYLRSKCGFKRLSTGKNTLSGQEALIYMRIRENIGGDEARVDRQQRVIKQMLAQAKSYGVSSMLSILNTMIPYIRTGLSSTDMLSYATNALTNGWLDYSIRQMSLPDNDCARGFRNTADHLWYWKVDYPVAARKLQLALYGQSNITLEANRKSWIQ